MDAGGPAWVPPAARVTEPVNWRLPKTVHQAEQKKKFIEEETVRVTEEARKKVGSNPCPVYQRLAMICVILANVDDLTKTCGPYAGAELGKHREPGSQQPSPEEERNQGHHQEATEEG